MTDGSPLQTSASLLGRLHESQAARGRAAVEQPAKPAEAPAPTPAITPAG